MPMLNPSVAGIYRGLNPSNGLAANMASRARRFPASSQGPFISLLEAPFIESIHPEIVIGNIAFVVIWNGKGPLTAWPETDWKLFRDESWQPIWSIQPRTSSSLLAARIRREFTAFDPAEYRRPFLASSLPKLVRVMEPRPLYEPKGHAVWRFTTGARVNTQSRVKLTPRETREVVNRQPADLALRELMYAEQLQPDSALSLCSKTNKVRHTSKLWALQHRLRLATLPDELHPERLEAYKCRWCGSWHVARGPQTVRDTRTGEGT